MASYSQDEIDIIIHCVENYKPLRVAYEEASKKLNRSFVGIRDFYTQHIRPTRKRISERPFTTEEDQIIRKCVESNYTNLQYAFKLATDQLRDRSLTSINKRWYNSLRNSSAIYGMISSNSAIANVKNTPRPKEDSMPLTVALLAIQQLTKDERIMVINQIMIMN